MQAYLFPEIKFTKMKKLYVLRLINRLSIAIIFLIVSVIGLQAQDRITKRLQNILDTAGTVHVGLVLAGGGAKGLAHIGVIKVLEEEGIQVEYVGGTSMGGLIGGLYATGNDSKRMEKIISHMNWDKLLSDKVVRRDLPIDEKADLSSYIISLPLVGFVPNLPRGLVKGQLVENEITKLTWSVNDIKDFSKLPIPFYCVATNIENGHEVVLDKGSLPVALRSTMSIPSVFEPVKLNGNLLVDGGLVNNFPVDIMRKKGMNFIIGVDVGANLYKRDEINSIVEILDQASSFYGRIKLEKNIANTDIYIRPDISGLSTLDFGEAEKIISRGEEAARAHIDELRSLARFLKSHNIKSITVVNKMLDTDSLYITDVKVNSERKSSRKIVGARINLKTPQKHSIEEINNAVNRVYYSGFFDKLTYSLKKNNEGYTLILNVKEKTSNSFRVGGRYDSYTEASLLLNIKLHNFLIDGSKLNFTAVLGPNPALGLRYSMDQGRKVGYALELGYKTRELFTYDEKFKNPTSSYFFSYTNAAFEVYSNYSSNRRVIFGTNFDYFNIKSQVGILPDVNLSRPIFNFYGKYIIDYYDDANYPLHGFKFNLTADQALMESQHPMTYIKADFETVITAMNEKLIFQPGLFAGATLGEPENYPYVYVIGGMGQNYIANMVPFAGMQYTSYFESNTIIARCKLSWNFLGKHYLFVVGNAGTFNDIFESMFYDSKFYYGGAIGYSLNSLIGPIEISWAASNQGPYTTSFLNIGYWF